MPTYLFIQSDVGNTLPDLVVGPLWLGGDDPETVTIL